MHTTPYRPEGNGSCERFNRTLISMLGTLPEEFKSELVNHVNMLTYAYNCTRSNATGFSPWLTPFVANRYRIWSHNSRPNGGSYSEILSWETGICI